MKKGIDVSTYQGIIKWNKVHASGVDFAMIKATQGRSELNSAVEFFEDFNSAQTLSTLMIMISAAEHTTI